MKILRMDAIRLLFFCGWMPSAALLLAVVYLRMDTILLQTVVI
jgi:hypothetical protein